MTLKKQRVAEKKDLHVAVQLTFSNVEEVADWIGALSFTIDTRKTGNMRAVFVTSFMDMHVHEGQWIVRNVGPYPFRSYSDAEYRELFFDVVDRDAPGPVIKIRLGGKWVEVPDEHRELLLSVYGHPLKEGALNYVSQGPEYPQFLINHWTPPKDEKNG